MPNFVKYSDFGAVCNGVTNDMPSIFAAHEYANTHGLPVKADDGATYYIGEIERTASIETDTDWGSASFIIDDSIIGIDKRGMNVFAARSLEKRYEIEGVERLEADQPNLGITLPRKSLVIIENKDKRQYIREGINQNNGSPQKDIILVDTDGQIDSHSPIMWSYDHITSIYAIPVEEKPLIIRGGIFTTIANQAPSEYTYYSRGIVISRSNVTVENLTHYIKGEGEHGAPYAGILQIGMGANVTVRDCLFTAHKTYKLRTNENNHMGSYDITPSSVINLTIQNCRQTTDILDGAYWGLIGSNFCKNILLENCVFSRFDAHQGVYNVTVKGCSLGHQCFNTIGRGQLTVEDCTLYGRDFICLRPDYGSSWNGDALIKNCKWIPACGRGAYNNSVFAGHYSGFHDFGYECYMPTEITIDGLEVDDSNAREGHTAINLFNNITPECVNSDYDERVQKEGYPYHVTESVTVKSLKCASGKPLKTSPNEYMFRNVKVEII